jgi:hypothetical protein
VHSDYSTSIEVYEKQLPMPQEHIFLAEEIDEHPNANAMTVFN